MTSLGYNVASKDMLVNVLLKKVIEKEESYIHQYIKLKELYPQCIDLPIKTEFEKLMEVKRLSLEYKLQSKEKQHSALLKVLEYLNNLEEKIQSNLYYKKTIIVMLCFQLKIMTFGKCIKNKKIYFGERKKLI